jgi:hypothetical protein
MSMENHGGMILTGKFLICTPKLPGNQTSSHLVEKQEGLAKEMMNFALQSIAFIFRRVLSHAVKAYVMGRQLYFPYVRRPAVDFYCP